MYNLPVNLQETASANANWEVQGSKEKNLPELKPGKEYVLYVQYQGQEPTYETGWVAKELDGKDNTKWKFTKQDASGREMTVTYDTQQVQTMNKRDKYASEWAQMLGVGESLFQECMRGKDYTINVHEVDRVLKVLAGDLDKRTQQQKMITVIKTM